MWVSSGSNRLQTVVSAESCLSNVQLRATCPVGTKVVSGGFIMSQWTSGAQQNSPNAMYTDSATNSFLLVLPGNSRTVCFKSVATCLG